MSEQFNPAPNHEMGRIDPEREHGATPDAFFLISLAVRERQEIVLNFAELRVVRGEVCLVES
jgi:hypothetical protein